MTWQTVLAISGLVGTLFSVFVAVRVLQRAPAEHSKITAEAQRIRRANAEDAAAAGYNWYTSTLDREMLRGKKMEERIAGLELLVGQLQDELEEEREKRRRVQEEARLAREEAERERELREQLERRVADLEARLEGRTG